MDQSKANQSRWKGRRDIASAGRPFLKNRKYRTDLQPLTEAQQDLASQYLPLARKLAQPMKLMFVRWKDEFESAACLALVEAARSFDPSRNIKFATFARFRIRGAMVDVGRSMELPGWDDALGESPDVVTLTPFNEEHGSVLVAVEPPPVGTETDDVDSVEQILRKLPERHATVCRLHYLYGKTQAEIGDVIGCSQSEIARLHRKSLDLLSEPYLPDGQVNRTAWQRKRVRRAAGTHGSGPVTS